MLGNKEETFSTLLLIVHYKGSFVALQEDLHRAAVSTGQGKQKCFYHNALCLGELTSGMQKKKKATKSPELLPLTAFVCRESHQMSAQPVLSFSRTCVSQEICNVSEKCLSVNSLSLQSLY